MTDDEKRCLKRREWVAVGTMPYCDGIIESREGRPLLPRFKMRIDYRAVPRNGKAMSFARLSDAKRWIDAQEIGGNSNGLLYEIAERRFRR